MTLHDLTTLCGSAHVTKLRWANIQGQIFSLLIVCCVKMGMAIMSSSSIEESFVASVWMREGITGQTMNQVMTPFQQQFGKACLCRTIFQCGKKCVYVEGYEGFFLEQLTNILNSDLCCGCRLHRRITTQVHAEKISRTWSIIFDHVWPQEGPGDEVILASVCNWTQQYWHETMSQSMCFVVGMISGSLVSWESSLFRWMCSLLQLPILKCCLGAKQNPRYMVEM